MDLPTLTYRLLVEIWSNLATIPVQAFVNLVLTLCDAGDSVVMFAPYYFNAYMSFQMTGVTNILVGPGDSKTLHPDAGWKPSSCQLTVAETTYDIFAFS